MNCLTYKNPRDVIRHSAAAKARKSERAKEQNKKKLVAISEIHHVAIAVSDMERSVAFYRDILGFRKTLDMPLNSPCLERLLRLRPGRLDARSSCSKG
jgi:catechol-2,3-dioxygenase